jgi:hypothetical protein
VAAVWLDYETFNKLPRHVRALDRLALMETGELLSLGAAEDMLLITEYEAGELYAEDLKGLSREGSLRELDLDRAACLGAYLADIHQVDHPSPELWRRRLRDLIGHGEGIMGLTDSYPSEARFISQEELRAIEEAANRWRWRLKASHHRLRQVHGDFHPFNVLFEGDLSFHVLDRSRGVWGAPEDDVSSMSLNYLFFSLQRGKGLDGPFRELHDCFWEAYFEKRQDEEMLRCIQPWFAWRALVLASPVWYPGISDHVRRSLFRFIQAVLESDRYDYQQVQRYLK